MAALECPLSLKLPPLSGLDPQRCSGSWAGLSAWSPAPHGLWRGGPCSLDTGNSDSETRPQNQRRWLAWCRPGPSLCPGSRAARPRVCWGQRERPAPLGPRQWVRGRPCAPLGRRHLDGLGPASWASSQVPGGLGPLLGSCLQGPLGRLPREAFWGRSHPSSSSSLLQSVAAQTVFGEDSGREGRLRGRGRGLLGEDPVFDPPPPTPSAKPLV